MYEYDPTAPDPQEKRRAIGCGAGCLSFLVGGILGGLGIAYRASQHPLPQWRVPPALLKFVSRYCPPQHRLLAIWMGVGVLVGALLLGVLGYFLGYLLSREREEEEL